MPGEISRENMISSHVKITSNKPRLSQQKLYIKVKKVGISLVFMAAWRYELSLLVLKNVSLVLCAHSRNNSTLEEKFRISARPCNVLYISLYLRYERHTGNFQMQPTVN